MRRTKAERRHNDWVKIQHKADIIKNVYYDGGQWFDDVYKGKEHILSKDKIHCSCPMCSAKTRRNGYKISDLRKIESLQSSLDEEGIDLKILPKVGGWVY